jgi:hypothetical protein
MNADTIPANNPNGYIQDDDHKKANELLYLAYIKL